MKTKDAVQRAVAVGLLCMTLSPTRAIAFTDFGKGRPVAERDLAGKTFCFDIGDRNYYAANGRFSSNRGHFRWSVPEPGILRVGRNVFQAEVLGDQIHLHKYCSACYGGDLDYWGKPC